MNKTTILTNEFEASHRCLPRGKGNWGFCPASRFGAVDYTQWILWFSGNYGVAKRQAARAFGALGVSLVVVCP